MVTYFFSQTVAWSLEDAGSLFCPQHLILRLSYIQLDQKHCLFLLPSTNKFIFRISDLCLLNYCCEHFSLNILVWFWQNTVSPPPPHPVALAVRVVFAEHAVCACRTSWPTWSLWSSIIRLFFKHCFNRHSLYKWIRLLTFASNCLLHVIMA